MSEAAEITIKGLSDLAVGTYLLVDVRVPFLLAMGPFRAQSVYRILLSRLKPESWQRIRNIYYIA